eukprot:6186569-Pleurochrysis_carterae.AAC.2
MDSIQILDPQREEERWMSWMMSQIHNKGLSIIRSPARVAMARCRRRRGGGVENDPSGSDGHSLSGGCPLGRVRMGLRACMACVQLSVRAFACGAVCTSASPRDGVRMRPADSCLLVSSSACVRARVCVAALLL